MAYGQLPGTDEGTSSNARLLVHFATSPKSRCKANTLCNGGPCAPSPHPKSCVYFCRNRILSYQPILIRDGWTTPHIDTVNGRASPSVMPLALAIEYRFSTRFSLGARNLAGATLFADYLDCVTTQFAQQRCAPTWTSRLPTRFMAMFPMINATVTGGNLAKQICVESSLS